MLPAKHQVQIKALLHHQRSNPQTCSGQSIFGSYIFGGLEMENSHKHHQQESQFHLGLPQKKPTPLSTALQEERLPGSCPFQTRVWECCFGTSTSRTTSTDRVQRSAAGFITGDYKSRHEGCVTNMLDDLDLPSLEERRREQRLTFLYKLVKRHVPAINIDQYLRSQKPKRTIGAKQFEDFVTKT